MTLLRRNPLLVAAALALGAVACGSGSSGDFVGHANGGPASADPVRTGSGSDGSSSGGGAGASADGGSADGALGAFGNENATSFTLIDTAVSTVPAGAPVDGYDPIKYGATIDLAVVGRQLSMRADPPPVAAIGSMAFALDATYTHTANTSPYSLCGDDGKGKFTPCELPVGPHTLTVTPYPETDLGGTPYTPTVFEFTIVDSAADAGADAGTD